MTIKPGGENVVFIAGCPRSGTTWLQRLIASHPMVRTGLESFVFPWYVHPVARRWEKELRDSKFAIGLSAYVSRDQGKELIEEYVKLLMDSITAELPPEMLFLEKTPDNSLHLREIAEYLPKAKVIHIIRDGRKVVASLLAAGREWGLGQWKELNAYSAAKLWARYLESVRQSKQHLPKDQFFELKYESLLRSPEEQLEPIFRFLGIQWTKEQIATAVRENSLDSEMGRRTKLAVRGEKARSLDQNQRTAAEYGSHSSGKGLNAGQRLLVWMAVRDTLKEYGYN